MNVGLQYLFNIDFLLDKNISDQMRDRRVIYSMFIPNIEIGTRYYFEDNSVGFIVGTWINSICPFFVQYEYINNQNTNIYFGIDFKIPIAGKLVEEVSTLF